MASRRKGATIDGVSTAVPQPLRYSGQSGPIPIMNDDLTFKTVGSSGLRQFGGWVREEFLPQLQGRQAARVYREMSDNNPMVAGMIFAITQSMRKIEWRVDPADDSAAAQSEADFVEGLRDDMSHTWDEFVTEALSCITYGFSPHELVYKKRLGRQKPNDATPSSKYDDGRVGWRRLPIRGQDTVLKWFFGLNGETLGLTQQPYVGPLLDIPITKMLLFRAGQHKGNPEGRSILRGAYVPYYFQKRAQELEAITLERMSGIPELRVPSELMQQAHKGDAASVAALAAYKKIVTNIRTDEQMGLVLPSDRWPGPSGPSPELMYEFKLTAPSGRPLVDSDQMIMRYKIDILMCALADFIQLGHGMRGSQELGIGKMDMFFQAIEGWLNSIAHVINRHALPRLWDLNAIDPGLMPEMAADMPQRIDLSDLSNFILRLSQSGMQLFPDEELENVLRESAGLPEVSDATRAMAQTALANQQAMDAAHLDAAQNPPQPKGVASPAQKAIVDWLIAEARKNGPRGGVRKRARKRLMAA